MLKKQLQAANKQVKADLVIKNGKIIDVFQGEITCGDVAVTAGKIVGIGEYIGEKEIDAGGRYISPTFIDSHVHIESSMVTPKEMARILLPHGVTAVITDPHELANVAGVPGIEFILSDSENIPFDVFVVLPSCVPATPLENAGAVLAAKDLQPLYQHPRVIGLAEIMDFPSVQSTAPDMMDKLAGAKQVGVMIDGHGAGLDAHGINIYRTAGIKTDHECTTAQEAKDRITRGMHVQIREGSVAKNLKDLVPAITPTNAHRFSFCTDDKHIDDLLEEGSINHNVRLAIDEGISPITAIQMASINAATCYGLEEKGAIAPGFDADFLLLDNLKQVDIFQVYKAGELVAEQGKMVTSLPVTLESETAGLLHSIHISDMTPEKLAIPMKTDVANVIGVIPNSLLTDHLTEQVQVKNGMFAPNLAEDQLKLVVIERHQKTGNIGLGIVKGFGIQSGAIATTIAHDSHNIVAVGTSDEEMIHATNALAEAEGGIVIVQEGKVLASLSLEIGGIMTRKPYEQVMEALETFEDALAKIGFTQDFNPLLTLSFLSLPVIPNVKLTDTGLFDVTTFQHIAVDKGV